MGWSPSNQIPNVLSAHASTLVPSLLFRSCLRTWASACRLYRSLLCICLRTFSLPEAHRVKDVHVDAGAVAAVAVAGGPLQGGVVQACQVPGGGRLHRQPRRRLRLHAVVGVDALDARIPAEDAQLAVRELWECGSGISAPVISNTPCWGYKEKI